MPEVGATLVAVLANPPLTAGVRTLRRVELAAELLGYAQVQIANLFAVPSHATGEIAVLGAEGDGWLRARHALESHLDAGHGMLLAYGVAAPTGPARLHHRGQIEWLDRLIAERNLPSWQVGDGPRHPSRWQRWTHRVHPGVPFVEALKGSLVLVSAASVGPGH